MAKGLDAYLITPEQLASANAPWQSCGLLLLDSLPPDAIIPMLPPFPLLGLGNLAHPLCARLDAVIEAPVSVVSIVRQVECAPLAAAAAMSLLRGVGKLDAPAALGLESLCYGMLQGSAEHAAWRDARTPSRMLAEGSVIVTRDGDTLTVILDRPWAHNAIDHLMRDQLHEAFTLAALDTSITILRLHANGDAFSVGADLNEFGTTRDPATAHAIRARTLPALALAQRPGGMEAHVQGACVGAALEMAAFAHRLTATRTAWFQLPELAMGIIPGAGGCVSIPRRIGRQRTALMLLSGRRINAATALRWGLIDAIIDEPPIDDGSSHHLC